MMRPTYEEIIEALPYLTHEERGRLRHKLAVPIPKAKTETIVTLLPVNTPGMSIGPIQEKVLRIREKSPPNSEN